MPKFSIIVPVYQVVEYLETCVKSLVSQTFKDIEIILVDDGSTDGSGLKCDELSLIDTRIHVIHQENAGVSVARNNGINHAKGEWILFVDGDDWVETSLCEQLYNTVTKNNCDVVFFSFFLSDGKSNKKGKLVTLRSGDVTEHKEYIEKKIISQYYDDKIETNGVSAGTCWGKAIKKSIITDHKIQFVPGLIRAQDTVFWLNAVDKCQKVFFLDEPLYYYRISNNSITSGKKYIPDSRDRFGMLLTEYSNFIIDNKKDEEYTQAFYIRTIQVVYWNYLHNICNRKNSGSIITKVKSIRKLRNDKRYADGISKARLLTLSRRQRVVATCLRHGFCFLSYLAFLIIEKK